MKEILIPLIVTILFLLSQVGPLFLRRRQEQPPPARRPAQGPPAAPERTRVPWLFQDVELARPELKRPVAMPDPPIPAPLQPAITQLPPAEGRRGAMSRLSNLTEWQRAIVLMEILGPPVAERDPSASSASQPDAARQARE